MPIARRLPSLAVSAALIVGACASSSPPTPSAGPITSNAPTPVPSSSTTAGIDHPIGATDVVLRYAEGGGFGMVEWSLAETPIFTLYGDGTVVFRDLAAQPPPDENGRLAFPPLRTAKLSADQIGALLNFAIAEGGLAAARDRYEHPMLADVGNAIFTLNAGGRTKEVTVSGLQESDASAPDQLSRSQFLKLAERLRNFDEDGQVPTGEFTPAAWRVHLLEGAGEPVEVHPWPWPELTPRDFEAVGDEPTGPASPPRIMTAAEIAALDPGGLKGGLMGHYIEGPDDKLYSVVVRPLLPGEER